MISYNHNANPFKSVHIAGGRQLNGSVSIQGSKNAVLPIMAAALLVNGISVLRNCPKISDVYDTIDILCGLGCKIKWEDDALVIDAKTITCVNLSYEKTGKLRGSIVLLGALLARCGQVSIDLPGGCNLGPRPIDLHLEALKKLGADIEITGGTICAKADRLRGQTYRLPFASVGVTENILLASFAVDKTLILENAAKEPEVSALIGFLRRAGMRIEGLGTDRLIIQKGNEETSVIFTIPPDRIVAGTYIFAVVTTGGRLHLENVSVSDILEVIRCAGRMGAQLLTGGDGKSLSVCATGRPKAVPFVRTVVYPGFPTDLQAPLIVAQSISDGVCVVEETIFPDRFAIADDLNNMGARILVWGHRAIVKGVSGLSGSDVSAGELRGGASLVIAGLAAQGVTRVGNLAYINRGYEDIVRDFSKLGGLLSYM